MITHAVLFRYSEGAFTDELERLTYETYSELVKKNIGILSFEVKRNIIERAGNYTVAVILKLEDESVLNRYLNDPVHIEYVKKICDHVISRASIDF